MIETSAPYLAAAHAFDQLAESYDALFTESLIGQAQRAAVWRYADKIFSPGSRILELNCGTGVDAIHFARRGCDVTACDISPAMVAHAECKAAASNLFHQPNFYVQAIESIEEIPHDGPFDAAFSNFSGLNCVQDISRIARALAQLLYPKSSLLFCLSTRFCAWEMAWYLLRGDFTRAFRRCRGFHQTKLGGVTFPVYYPILAQIRRSFEPEFKVVSVRGIGLTVPPSYVEPWIARYPKLLHRLEQVDAAICALPWFRVLGDHMLVHLERRSS